MLNLCIDWKKVEVEFMGEKITAEVRPPSPDHMLVLTPHLNFTGEGMNEIEATQKIYKMQNAVVPILPEIIRNIEGVTNNGKPVDSVMLGTESAFGTLVMLLITEVINSANLDKESEKNLRLPREEKSPGQIAAE